MYLECSSSVNLLTSEGREGRMRGGRGEGGEGEGRGHQTDSTVTSILVLIES